VPSGVYSERFIATQGQAGMFTYDVPAGRRLVLKCITALNFGTGAAVFSVSISGRTVLYRSLPGGSDAIYTGLLIPAYEGEFVRTEIPGTFMAVTISGFLFDATGDGGELGQVEHDELPQPYVVPCSPVTR
jgi:hypothetical protein